MGNASNLSAKNWKGKTLHQFSAKIKKLFYNPFLLFKINIHKHLKQGYLENANCQGV